ncbi:hypothetical protein ISF_06358 [Cordyceps fumosorosea ARSEF 2679]|uniref:Myb-like DNA-binding domain-containing protein n=1 Tax=Cordyceps fumosorosea (strain ARSEF 2679) TaxID=1081104 RepID=A0A167SAE8_CORFA|nr:hypothetical protein ISF_06358 [Cordyceps fumosorosea ARSEF 2679]OAA59423.1 hypothetical protein ISF_06358 [Cordyceps fumosorosea ARSEF 2679]
MSNKAAGSDQNVRFLVACINHSTNGKPNFELVAKELDIVSKGAATKRYERLLKSIASAPKPTAAATTTADDDDGDEAEPAKPPAKKRKAPAAPKASAVKKAKTATRAKKPQVKDEGEEKEEEKVDVKAESDSSLSGTCY